MLDTVVSQIGSAVHVKVRLFNHSRDNTEDVLIRLADGDDSPFLINVNGIPGSESVHNIRGKDSLFVFVQLKSGLLPNSDNWVEVVSDKIIVESGEHSQNVVLKCPVIHAIEKQGEMNDAVWVQDSYIFVSNDVTIPSGHTLEIESGVKIFFNNGARFIVNGGLKVLGSCDKRVFFRSYRYDNLTRTIKYEQVPKQWGGIYIKESTQPVVFKNAVIMGANTGLHIGEPGGEDVSVDLLNTIMRYNGDVNILAFNTDLQMYNCLLSNSEQQIIMYGGRMNMIHSTVANYYEWRDSYYKSAIELNDADPLGHSYVFDKSDITNSIIYGIQQNEIVVPEDALLDYFQFNQVILKSTADIEGILTQSPNFVSLIHYEYDFHLQENSPGIDFGIVIEDDRQYFDLDCKPRGSRIDVGVYQF